MAEKGLTRLTVYKLASNDLEAAKIPGYKLAAKGKHTIDKKPVSYRLYFYRRGPHPPSWLHAFEDLNLLLPKRDWPETISSGFILLVHAGASLYAVTGGVGHIHLRNKVAIEHRFGIDLAQRMLSLADLRGLVQRDTSGVVNVIDRGFRARYNPKGDLNNLRRVLKNVRGAFGKKDALYNEIGSSVQASDALTVNGRKQLTDVFAFLLRVEEVWTKAAAKLSIPQLEHINKKVHGPLLDSLQVALIDELIKFDPDTSNAFFLDNADIGYLPDRAIKYDLIHGSTSQSGTSYQDVLTHVRDVLSSTKSPDRPDALRSLKVAVEFDDGFTGTYALSHLLCGDVTYKGDVYFLDNDDWFRASKEYVAALTRELDNIECVDPGKLGLLEWSHTEEALYNAGHKSLHVLDRHPVKVADEKGPIEFCDLLIEHPERIHLVHVKPESGAALRALFAQGYVSAFLYAQAEEFRDKVHSGDLQQDKGKDVGPRTKAVLAKLKARPLRELTVVFAIYDDTRSHVVAPSATGTSEVLKGTLTTFAKADLLTRATELRAMGYEVAVCRIRPYPKPKGAK